MLMLNSQAWTIEGIQVFADHADPRQFWYLPGPVQLTRRREDGRAEFTFIKVRAADAANTAARGGGFLTFSVDLRLDPELERRILSKLSAMARGKPRLSAVPFDEGSVRVIALDLDSGATASPGAAAPPAGTFRAVEKALGATVPSLDAINRASFSLTLSQEGAIIVEQAFRQGGTPVGVIYELKYSGMRPALDVTITADMSRVFEQFAGSVDSQVMFVRGGIDAGFEKLVQDGAIRIEVHDFIGAADHESKETWAINFFKESLLAQYFTPTLTVGELRGGIPQTEGLDAVLKRGEALRPPPTPAPSRPTSDEVVTRPAPPANPADSPTAGTGRGGTQPGRVAQPPAGGPGESPTESTGQAAGAGTGATLGSSAAAGVSPTVTAGRPPGTPAGATTGGTPTGGGNAAGGATGAGTVGGAASGGGSTPGATGAAPTTPATTSSSSATPTQGGGAQAVTAFRFRGIKQEERKKLVFRYSRSEATQRSYAPQGFFGLLAGDLDKKSHFIEVDLDDPFFRRFEIKVSTIPDFAAIGLSAAEIALSYGKPGDPGGVKSQNLRFEGQNAAEQSWTVFQNDGDVQSLRFTVQFHFDPASGFEGSKLSYEFGPFETTDRTIVLNPFEHIGVRTISAVANKIDWGQIERVEVTLTSGQQKKTLTLTEAAKEAAWKLRLDSPEVRTIGYSTTFVMKDRTTRGGEVGTTEASSILVDDPFPEGLSLQLIPILDAARTRLAFVDFDYADPPSGFKRSERFRIAPTDLDREVRVGLPKGATKSFRFRVTVVPKTGAMRAGEFVDSTETLIAVSD
ncbi:MAG: hypothetical protein AB7F22_10310 [Reyranella sp.]|uniref:hypothetical protein n=1 Tax=Reyranella sp. TaxID=1929291 RepID=UPI003D132880